MFIGISVIKQHLRMQGGLCMERKFEIPKMSNEEIAHWYATIKPIVGHDTYLRKLSAEELTNVAYTWLNEPTDMQTKLISQSCRFWKTEKCFMAGGIMAFLSLA